MTRSTDLALCINGYPLGYLYPLFNSIMYGLTLGTNSFAFPMPERMAPPLAVLERAGPYEFAGYILIVVATYSLARFEIPHFFQGNLQWVTRTPALRLTREQWLGIALGVLIVALAGLREAMMIVTVDITLQMLLFSVLLFGWERRRSTKGTP